METLIMLCYFAVGAIVIGGLAEMGRPDGE
jgi:hypothetical protein